MRCPTQNERVLALLQTGPKSTHEILREVPCIVHSRIAELRERGHEIDCARDGDVYTYTLVPSLGEPNQPQSDGGEDPRRSTTVAESANPPGPRLGSPNEAEEQLSLLAPPRRGAYSEAA